MKLHFLGGAGEVGRSAVLAETEEMRLLFDCGIKAGPPYQFPLLAQAKRPHAIALSHAHLDHSGYLPGFYRHESAPVLATFPTFPLVSMLLADTQKIAEQERLTPYFSDKDLHKMQSQSRPLPYRQPYAFHDGSTLELLDAGHILGSAQELFKSKEGSVLYTGDFNATSTRLHEAAEFAHGPVDTLIMESTYGGNEHPDRKQLEEKFAQAIREAVEDDSAVLIPSFAIGRTQEILSVLQAHGLADHVVLDGMGIKASEIFLEFPSYLRNPDELAVAFNKARKVDGPGERKAVAKAGNVIVATAGMVEGGPVMSYVQHFMKKGVRAHIFLTGFQVKGTRGRRLLEEGTLRINGKLIKWPWEVRFFDFSAHADARGLLRHVKKANPQRIFNMHGDPEQLKACVNMLQAEGFDAYAPREGERITL